MNWTFRGFFDGLARVYSVRSGSGREASRADQLLHERARDFQESSIDKRWNNALARMCNKRGICTRDNTLVKLVFLATQTRRDLRKYTDVRSTVSFFTAAPRLRLRTGEEEDDDGYDSPYLKIPASLYVSMDDDAEVIAREFAALVTLFRPLFYHQRPYLTATGKTVDQQEAEFAAFVESTPLSALSSSFSFEKERTHYAGFSFPALGLINRTTGRDAALASRRSGGVNGLLNAQALLECRNLQEACQTFADALVLERRVRSMTEQTDTGSLCDVKGMVMGAVAERIRKSGLHGVICKPPSFVAMKRLVPLDFLSRVASLVHEIESVPEFSVDAFNAARAKLLRVFDDRQATSAKTIQDSIKQVTEDAVLSLDLLPLVYASARKAYESFARADMTQTMDPVLRERAAEAVAVLAKLPLSPDSVTSKQIGGLGVHCRTAKRMETIFAMHLESAILQQIRSMVAPSDEKTDAVSAFSAADSCMIHVDTADYVAAMTRWHSDMPPQCAERVSARLEKTKDDALERCTASTSAVCDGMATIIAQGLGMLSAECKTGGVTASGVISLLPVEQWMATRLAFIDATAVHSRENASVLEKASALVADYARVVADTRAYLPIDTPRNCPFRTVAWMATLPQSAACARLETDACRWGAQNLSLETVLECAKHASTAESLTDLDTRFPATHQLVTGNLVELAAKWGILSILRHGEK